MFMTLWRTVDICILIYAAYSHVKSNNEQGEKEKRKEKQIHQVQLPF